MERMAVDVVKWLKWLDSRKNVGGGSWVMLRDWLLRFGLLRTLSGYISKEDDSCARHLACTQIGFVNVLWRGKVRKLVFFYRDGNVNQRSGQAVCTCVLLNSWKDLKGKYGGLRMSKGSVKLDYMRTGDAYAFSSIQRVFTDVGFNPVDVSGSTIYRILLKNSKDKRFWRGGFHERKNV